MKKEVKAVRRNYEIPSADFTYFQTEDIMESSQAGYGPGDDIGAEE